jgi:hypothetical protein
MSSNGSAISAFRQPGAHEYMSSLRAWKFGAICGIVYRSTANRARPDARRRAHARATEM